MAGSTRRAQDRLRWLYRAEHAIWLWLGLAAVLSLVAWIADPVEQAERSAVGRQLGSGIDDAWHVLLAFGGIAIAHGVWTMRVRAEIIGHLFVGVAVLIYGAAATIVNGPIPAAFILFGVAAASASRIWFLLQTAAKPQ